jgi:hypothetical protein
MRRVQYPIGRLNSISIPHKSSLSSTYQYRYKWTGKPLYGDNFEIGGTNAPRPQPRPLNAKPHPQEQALSLRMKTSRPVSDLVPQSIRRNVGIAAFFIIWSGSLYFWASNRREFPQSMRQSLQFNFMTKHLCKLYQALSSRMPRQRGQQEYPRDGKETRIVLSNLVALVVNSKMELGCNAAFHVEVINRPCKHLNSIIIQH